MDQKELNEILDLHSKWLRNEDRGRKADLYGADLSGTNLSGANLRWADLRWTNLSGANLRETDLREANLYGTNLYGVSLYGANLRWADLRWTNLSGANLRETDLREADLRWTNLSGANLRWANLSGAKDGNNELLKCNTVLGLKWSILMFQDVVTVGCEKHKLDEWRNFTEDEIGEMHRGALDFYPILMAILEYEYRNTKWSKQEK